ncbi:MAG: hypothetical protein JXP73_13945 [Deltaproteobacteria bacterium]|nr:hypothetical protein [Deltaproteobacteria bacterium]
MNRPSPWLLASIFACGCGNPELVAGRWVDLQQTDSHAVLRNLAASSDGRVFVATRPGVLRSRDRLGFERLGEGWDVALVAVDRQDHVYAAVEQYEQSPEPLRISFDGGDTWAAGTVPAGITVKGIVADPSASGRVYLVGDDSVGQGNLYRSDDGGANFARISDWGGVLAVDGDGAIYLARYDGLWRSDDQGVTFLLQSAEPAGANLSPRFVLTDPGNAGHLIVGTQDGLYTTTDGGATWSRTDPGVTSSSCSVIYQNAARVPGSPSEIYMAVNAAGIYHSADNGLTWEAKNNGLTGECINPLGIGVVAGTDVVVYATILGTGRDAIFAFLAE